VNSFQFPALSFLPEISACALTLRREQKVPLSRESKKTATQFFDVGTVAFFYALCKGNFFCLRGFLQEKFPCLEEKN
jgi:hypothetical protein